MKWTDETSYKHSDTERIPTTWTAKAGRLRITVTRGHIYYPDKWVMHCSPFFDTHELNVETKEQAQVKATLLVREIVYNILLGLDVSE